MNNDGQMENEILNEAVRSLKDKSKKALKKLLLKLLVASLPLVLAIMLIILAGAGAMQVFSLFGGVADALFGRNDSAALAQYGRNINALTIDEIIELVENGVMDESFLSSAMFSKEEFLYLLNSVKEKNEEHVVRTIQIETRHTYQEWEEDSADPADPTGGSGHWEEKEDWEYRDVQVDSREYEWYQIDWQMVVAMCCANVVNEGLDWAVQLNDAGEKEVSHYGENHEVIDEAIEAVSMKYTYFYDLARDEKSVYSMDDCKAMVHTKYLYGDKDTTSGEWEYYIPHSALRSASSAYSTMYYEVYESDYGAKLTHLVEASFMPLYDLTMRRFTYNYLFDYTCDLMDLLPGGKSISQKLKMYREYEAALEPSEDGTSKPGTIIKRKELPNYDLGDGMALSEFPVSTRLVNSDYGDIDYDGIEFNEDLGGIITMAALEKVGCAYSMSNRWGEGTYDCSSFVWRVLGEVGINLSEYCSGTTAAAICRGMVTAGKVIDPADIRQGDIIFYSYEANGRFMNVSHTAIYAGDGKKVHAKGAAYGVVYDRYSTSGMVCVCRPY